MSKQIVQEEFSSDSGSDISDDDEPSLSPDDLSPFVPDSDCDTASPEPSCPRTDFEHDDTLLLHQFTDVERAAAEFLTKQDAATEPPESVESFIGALRVNASAIDLLYNKGATIEAKIAHTERRLAALKSMHARVDGVVQVAQKARRHVALVVLREVCKRGRLAALGTQRSAEAVRLQEEYRHMNDYDPRVESTERRLEEIDTELKVLRSNFDRLGGYMVTLQQLARDSRLDRTFVEDAVNELPQGTDPSCLTDCVKLWTDIVAPLPPRPQRACVKQSFQKRARDAIVCACRRVMFLESGESSLRRRRVES